MKLVSLTKGKFAKVDDEDFERVSAFKWYADFDGYAERGQRMGKKKLTIHMHSFLLGAMKGQEIDHKNGDKLDNQRSNIRICTRTQNLVNRGALRSNKSGHRGVVWEKEENRRKKPWRAQITYSGRLRNLGRFASFEEAVKMYRDTAQKLFGEFARFDLVSK